MFADILSSALIRGNLSLRPWPISSMITHKAASRNSLFPNLPIAGIAIAIKPASLNSFVVASYQRDL